MHHHAIREHARWDCLAYIEGHCNRRRPHSAIGWRMSGEAMDEFMERIRVDNVEGVVDEAA